MSKYCRCQVNGESHCTDFDCHCPCHFLQKGLVIGFDRWWPLIKQGGPVISETFAHAIFDAGVAHGMELALKQMKAAMREVVP